MRIVAWKLTGYDNEDNEIDLSEMPGDLANSIDSWISEMEEEGRIP